MLAGVMMRVGHLGLLVVMPEGLLWILIFIAVVIAYTIAKVVQHNRRSEEQWRSVDKSKLREWDDDDDWDR
ncbi:MAG: hypothetical protein GTO71_05335 [Woeseiaceae bacterium]|nr:hypothetical protein [Woeseiaceae bacterium]NIP20521.1 hypothetical protein [Woeseiaceae bacterium]NIS89115.1 hypothetical protein [Woeseiaceae bacterium]